jgi:hypothetical protein
MFWTSLGGKNGFKFGNRTSALPKLIYNYKGRGRTIPTVGNGAKKNGTRCSFATSEEPRSVAAGKRLIFNMRKWRNWQTHQT